MVKLLESYFDNRVFGGRVRLKRAVESLRRLSVKTDAPIADAWLSHPFEHIGDYFMSDRNKEIVKKLNAAVRANNLEEFLSFYTDDAQWTKVGDKSAQGKEALRQLILGLGDAPPPSTTTFDAMIAEGDSVAAYGSLTIEVQPGKTISQSFCDIYRFRGDKIYEFASFVITPEAKFEASSGT